MKILLVIDMQNDFITGALGTKEAVTIVDYVKEKVEAFEGECIFTRDTHQVDYIDTREGEYLPVPHCIEGSEGWKICKELLPVAKGCDVVDKPTFGSMKLIELVKLKCQKDNCMEKELEFTLVGLCTDICVISNAMLIKAAFPESKIIVDSSGCAGVMPESHDNALAAMKMCHIEIV